jgi:Xaa-Pro aminopeptidase
LGVSFTQDRVPGTPTIENWLGETLTKGNAVGIDPFLFSTSFVNKLSDSLKPKGISVRSDLDNNLVDAVWDAEKPSVSKRPLRVHPIELAGLSADAKLAVIRQELTRNGAAAVVLAALDEIAWLINIVALTSNTIQLPYATPL